MLKKFLEDNFTNYNGMVCNQDKKTRIEFIDLAKGICIFLVVIYHTEIVRFDIPGLKAVRMPLYFILSGLFFKNYGGIFQLALRKVNKILVPFLFFYIISWLECTLVDLAPWNTTPVAEPFHALFTQRIGPIWFLECLFFTVLAFGAICNTFNSEYMRFIAVIFMGVIGNLLSLKNIFLPCQIDVVFTAMPFFYLGYILKKTPLLYPSRQDRFALPLGVAMLIAGSVLYYLLDRPFIEFWNNTMKGNLLVNYILSFIFVIGVMMICKGIKWLPVISYIGRYSIIVLVMHQIVLQFMKTFEPYLLGYGINYVYFVFTFGISWLSIPVLRKYLPQFTAQADFVKECHIIRLENYLKV